MPPPSSATVSRDQRVRVAADQLIAAATARRPCAPVRHDLPDTDPATGYAVQQLLTQDRLAHGAHVIGRKIGLTSLAVQAQLGVDQPDFGVLFDDMRVASAETVALGRLLQPKIEAEIAFVLATDLSDPTTDAGQARAAVEYAVAALEIVDSRIAGWDITLVDTIADNASCGLVVLGDTRVPLDDADLRTVQMSMTDRSSSVVSSGEGAACLGDPLEALAWLARTAAALGDPLRSGELVLSGALGPMVPVRPGDEFTAELSGFGRVSVRFATAEEKS